MDAIESLPEREQLVLTLYYCEEPSTQRDWRGTGSRRIAIASCIVRPSKRLRTKLQVIGRAWSHSEKSQRIDYEVLADGAAT